MENTKIISLIIVITILLLSPLIISPRILVAEQIPREEVVFTSSAWGPPPGWNPLLPSVCWMASIMYPSLYLYTPYKDLWIPYAAESYRWVDKYTLEVKIRDKARWWDGKPCTADDIKYTAELGRKYVVAWITPIWDYIEEVRVIDSKTVQFVTSEKKLNYLQLLGVLTMIFLPKHRWEAIEAELGEKMVREFRDDDPAKIIGAGPYRLKSWTEEVYYYERVDDWWGKDIFGLPKPRYIAHRTFKDNVAAALAFEAGEIDMMTHFTPNIWEMWRVKGLARRTYYDHPPYYIGGGIILVYINYVRYPLNDVNVRRAVAHVIPFDDLISKAYYNYSIRAAPVPIVHTTAAAVWIDESLVEKYKFEFDLSKARKILDDAGIIDRDGDGVREMPDGTKLGPFTIQVPYGWTDWMMMCDMIATNLRAVGIDCTTEFPDFSVWWDRLSRGTWDFVIGWDGGPGYSHPWDSFRWTLDPRLSHPAGNWPRYMNWEAVPLIDQIPKESDPEKLKELYRKLQEIFLRDLPGIPLFYGAVWYEYSEDYWVGWPREEFDPWFANFWSWPSNMPVWFYIAKKGEVPKVPEWVEKTKFPTSKIWADLAAVLAIKKGVLSIDTTPVKAEVIVNGESWGIAPVSREVVVGRYIVEFKPVEGYATPSPEIVEVKEGVVTSIIGTYTPITPVTIPEIGEILDRLKTLSDRLTTLTDDVKSLSKAVADLKTAIDALSGKIAGLATSADVSGIRTEISALRGDLAAISSISYAVIAVVVITLIVSIVALLRRPSK